MSRFQKTIVIVVLILAAMLLLTFISPDIRAFATDLSKQTNVPIWLVGLAAPILFVFNRLGRFLSGLFGEGATGRSIRDANEAIKTKLDDVEHSIDRLDRWRRNEIEPRLRWIDQQQEAVGALEGRATDLAAGVPGLLDEQAALREKRDRLQRALDQMQDVMREIE
jgi:uncharacterized protein (DUF2164 family)